MFLDDFSFKIMSIIVVVVQIGAMRNGSSAIYQDYIDPVCVVKPVKGEKTHQFNWLPLHILLHSKDKASWLDSWRQLKILTEKKGGGGGSI